MAASIRSLINAATPIVGGSRDDLRPTDVVTVNSVDTATTYAWTLAYSPPGSAAAFSGDVTQQSPGDFTVDLEGPYLVRLTVDLGLGTENTQFVRLRLLTLFADLKLVAAGEQLSSSLPVPVDQTIDGWADEQNTNLSTLLGFIATVSASGRILYVDQNDSTEGYADHDSVQDAIDAAVAGGASIPDPWIVLVRPGTYIEDITFAPHVHVVGWPGNSAGSLEDRTVVIRAANDGGTGTHEVATPLSTDRIILANLLLESVSSSVTAAATRKTGDGTMVAYRCVFSQTGVSALVGPALRVQGGTTLLEGCEISAVSTAFADRRALDQSGGDLEVRRSKIIGTSGAQLNSGLVAGVTASFTDCRIISTGGAGSSGISSAAATLLLEYCRVERVGGDSVRIGASIGYVEDTAFTSRWSFIQGDLVFDTTNLSGTTALNIGASEYNSISLPGGSPTTTTATTKSTSLFFDNTTTGMAAENVQDAIDETYAFAELVRTLDDAYDAGIGAGGGGRTIVADSGPVRIVDAPSPSDPIPPSNADGQLEVVSKVRIGAINKPEIDLDPNPFGNGPMVTLGRSITPNNAPFGPSSIVKGNSTGDPDFTNYNLRLLTMSSEGGGRIGRAILRGGDALDNGVATPDAGSVYIQAGSAFDAAAGEGGDVYLAPGDSSFGAVRSIILARPDNGTPATLTAAGAFAGGVTGKIRFAINMGAIEIDIDAGDNLAAVLVLLNASGHVTAIDSGGGVIRLTTKAIGPNAEVHYLNDDVAGTLDIALGVFDGESQVDGTWPDTFPMQVTAADELTMGVGGATGPMIYNSATGKLTVPGVIDPTALIFEDAPPFAFTGGHGTLWVADGTGGTTLGDLYYIHEFGASATTRINLAGQSVLAGTVTAEDEGGALGQFDTFDFIGPGVTASDAGGGKLNVTVTSGGVEIKDEGVSLGIFNAIDFIGATVQSFGVGGVALVYIPPPIFDSHWDTSDGGNGDQSVTETASRVSAHISTPSGGEGTPFNTSGWATTDQEAALETSVTFTTPSTTTGFGGDSTMTITMYDADGSTVLETFTTPIITGNAVHTSGSGRIAVTITSYGIDAFRFKANASVEVMAGAIHTANGLVGGRYHVEIVHDTDTTTDGTITTYVQSDLFLDTNPTTPSLGGATTITETGGFVVTKHLSGLEYYDLGSDFTVDVPDIDQLNRNTSKTTGNLRVDGTEYGLPTLDHSPFGTGSGNFTGWTNAENVDNVSYNLTTWEIDAASHRYIGPTGTVGAIPRDPWADGSQVDSTDASILVDTFGITSTDLVENFDDEDRRQDSGYNVGTSPGNWTSTTFLAAGEAQVFGGLMIVPNTSTYIRSDGANGPNTNWTAFKPDAGGVNPDYTSLGAPVSHYRTIVDSGGSNRASFQIVFSGTFVVDATTDLANGDLEIYIRRRASAGGGDTGPGANPLELHGALYNFATFDDGVTDGKIREGTSSGGTVNGTFGGFSCEDGFFIEVKIIDATIQLDSYTVIFI